MQIKLRSFGIGVTPPPPPTALECFNSEMVENNKSDEKRRKSKMKDGNIIQFYIENIWIHSGPL